MHQLEATNTTALPIVIYTFNIVNWNLEDKTNGQKDRKVIDLKQNAPSKSRYKNNVCLKTRKGKNKDRPGKNWMLYVVLQHEKKKKLHSVVKGSRKFKSQLFAALEESKSNMTAMKGAKEIKQNAKQPCQEDMLVKKI